MTNIIKHDHDTAHWYTDIGEPRYDANLRTARKENLLPSVTTVIRDLWPKPMLQTWKMNQVAMAAATTPRLPNESDEQWSTKVQEAANEITASTADWGKRFHALIEARAKFQVSLIPDDLKPYWDAFELWWNKNVGNVHFVEYNFAHRGLGYAGRIDLVVTIAGVGKCVLDTKTRDVKDGKPFYYPEQAVQLSAYNMGLPCGERPNQLASLIVNRLTPEEPYLKVWKEEEMRTAERQWSALLTLWKEWKKYEYKPKKREEAAL